VVVLITAHIIWITAVDAMATRIRVHYVIRVTKKNSELVFIGQMAGKLQFRPNLRAARMLQIGEL
jgi:hypothetical protein